MSRTPGLPQEAGAIVLCPQAAHEQEAKAEVQEQELQQATPV